MSTSLELTSALEGAGALTPVGLILEGEIDVERMTALGTMLGSVYGSMQFAIGDYLIECEKRFGHEAAQIIESLNISAEAAAQHLRVAEAIPLSDRVDGVSWSHHRAVAHLTEDERAYYLNKAKSERWSKRELEANVKADLGPKATKELPAPPAPVASERLIELLTAALTYIEHFVPVDDALIDGFNVDAWVDDVRSVLGVT